MCMSPHEMPSSMIEEDIEYIRGLIARGSNPQIWESRIKALEELLKERAEDGTYATAGIQ